MLSSQAAVGTTHSRINTLVRTLNSFTLIIELTSSVRVITKNAAALHRPRRLDLVALAAVAIAIYAAALCVTKEGFLLSFDSLTLIVKAATSVGVVTKNARLVIDPNCKS